MTKIIDAKPDVGVRCLTDVEIVHVAGAGLPLVVQPQISNSLVAAETTRQRIPDSLRKMRRLPG